TSAGFLGWSHLQHHERDQEITSQTSSGTTAIAKSIGNLAKMANEMRHSVSGFTLPDAKDQA
ncbi:hypothetical protein, partial [Klebsiella pneumoniae]|uniref:hypothetical protein n=1 Tax=Klebsiella pneumoniae TaxID=573 RepID=UPI0025563A78